ncbi:MAG: 50S ribosomal protein L17 [Nitrospirae bacterium]|nr:50S ribosomal protein L17 [Nitrospirota bacterium]
MRHKCSGRQFGRNSGHRKALFRSLVTSFFEHERIETTEAKAKEIRTFTEEMITLGKRGDLHARRQAASFILKKDVVSRLFKDIAPRFATRNGGYTRLVKTRRRHGDGAEMAILELVDYQKVQKEKLPASETEKKSETKTAA